MYSLFIKHTTCVFSLSLPKVRGRARNNRGNPAFHPVARLTIKISLLQWYTSIALTAAAKIPAPGARPYELETEIQHPPAPRGRVDRHNPGGGARDRARAEYIPRRPAPGRGRLPVPYVAAPEGLAEADIPRPHDTHRHSHNGVRIDDPRGGDKQYRGQGAVLSGQDSRALPLGPERPYRERVRRERGAAARRIQPRQDSRLHDLVPPEHILDLRQLLLRRAADGVHPHRVRRHHDKGRQGRVRGELLAEQVRRHIERPQEVRDH